MPPGINIWTPDQRNHANHDHAKVVDKHVADGNS